MTNAGKAVVELKLEQVRTLPSVAATHAYVPSVSGFDYIMQSLHSLLDWRIRIKAVALQDVDIIKLKAFQRLVHRIENVLRMRSVVKHGTGSKEAIPTLRLRPCWFTYPISSSSAAGVQFTTASTVLPTAAYSCTITFQVPSLSMKY